MELSEDRHEIRRQLKGLGLAAFVADGAILPRASGISQKPLKDAVPFRAPESLKVELTLPYAGKITGMGVPKGIVLIVGGGYHGKSTLLEALERGVYDHIAGDGREYVITDDTAVKIRAEDGRSIQNVDISMFINHLPNGRDTKLFTSENASGSTSQAANVIEAMEAGTGLFLIDEDTSATNFMIRDELMQAVVSRADEPITPFIDRIRELYEVYNISSIIVAGSSGSYFHKADCILQMNQYLPEDITEFAKQKAAQFPMTAPAAAKSSAPSFDRRIHRPAQKEDRVKIKTFGRDSIQVNHETIDMRYAEQLADSEQLTALGYMVSYARQNLMDGESTLMQIAEALVRMMETEGFTAFFKGGYLPMGLAEPRRQEVYACLNRIRSLKI